MGILEEISFFTGYKNESVVRGIDDDVFSLVEKQTQI